MAFPLQLTMGRANFTECSARYMTDPDLIARYGYRGPVRLNTPNPQTQITYEGCVALCGRGNDYFAWSDVAATLTNWILPILGTLLQAPFESNAFWRTIKAINRWIGSPIASLAFILWDIEISGKCALFGRDFSFLFGSYKTDPRYRRLLTVMQLTWLFPAKPLFRMKTASFLVYGTLSTS
jgi:hypothetical protein